MTNIASVSEQVDDDVVQHVDSLVKMMGRVRDHVGTLIFPAPKKPVGKFVKHRNITIRAHY